MTTLKLKKGDTVQMLSGKDRGKQGRILEARPRDGKVHRREPEHARRSTRSRARSATRAAWAARRSRPAGSSTLPAPVSTSNVMLVCPTCKLPTRVGYRFKEAKGGEQVKVRVCKRDGCGQEIDR